MRAGSICGTLEDQGISRGEDINSQQDTRWKERTLLSIQLPEEQSSIVGLHPNHIKLVMVVDTCHPRNWETEAGRV